MNRKRRPRVVETWITIGIFFGLFLTMMVYLCIYVKNNERQLLSNNYNSRTNLLAKENIRGRIYDKDGNILAETRKSADGKETRSYPYDNLFAHAVGFSTKGKTGIESMANYYLINSNISITKKAENDMAGRKNPGNDVHSTLDLKLQEIAASSLGMFDGAVIVSEVKTGNILAMVSKPDFNPNNVVENWNKYLNAPKDESVLLNRATQGLYPPGSTFKIITALEYIRENGGTYGNYSYNCGGQYKKGDVKISCFHGISHDNVDFKESFAKSCNSSFANIGMSLNKSEFINTLNELQFNEKLPLEMNYSISSLSLSDFDDDEAMAQITIGQGKAGITPFLLHMITSSVANGGMVMKPLLIDYINDGEGNTIKTYEPEEYKRLMSESEALALSELMAEVVQKGTGTKLKSEYYTAAGKTGSAEFNGNTGDSHAWFTGFAPVENPEIAVTIIVEGVGTGGEYAVPIAKRIIDAYYGVY